MSPREEKGGDAPVEYDPLIDELPYPANPKGSPDEERMATVAYLGAIARINAEKKRGATSEEVTYYARKSNYSGGNAVTGWNTPKSGKRRSIDNRDGFRILNEKGHDFLQAEANALGITLTGDYTPIETSIQANGQPD